MRLNFEPSKETVGYLAMNSPSGDYHDFNNKHLLRGNTCCYHSGSFKGFRSSVSDTASTQELVKIVGAVYQKVGTQDSHVTLVCTDLRNQSSN